MAVTVLGLAGSPRRKGNTEILLDWTLAAAESAGAVVVKFRLRELDIGCCIACDGCSEDGICIVDDGMDKLYPHLREADSIALAAPIFSMGLAAQAKAMVDRCQPFWALKHVLGRRIRPEGAPGRRGAFLSCAGTDYKTAFDGARQVVNYFWHVLDVQPIGDLLCPGVDAKGEILEYPSAREIAEDIGRRLAEPR
jgi:multimeric flavodoxin WrbA